MIDGKTVAFFGCKHTTKEIMESFIENIGEIDYLITIPEKIAESAQVSGFIDIQPFASQNNIEIYNAKSYSLNEKEDYNWIKSKCIDLGLVMGWQRLIPKNILDLVSIGFFGMHGSADNLPRGRGRSPMNWAIITGRSCFYTNLFKYDDTIDGGQIAGSEMFTINEYDTIETLHYKNTLSMFNLLRKFMEKILNGKVHLKSQGDNGATYFPKRNPEDGFIDWSLKTEHIYNLVRALKDPFPGAFSYAGKSKIVIWELYPFNIKDEFYNVNFGEIVKVFSNGKFCVKTKDGTAIVSNYEIADKSYIKESVVLESKPYKEVYGKIVTRYPSFITRESQKEITLSGITELYSEKRRN